jgi:hypothetical protein
MRRQPVGPGKLVEADLTAGRAVELDRPVHGQRTGEPDNRHPAHRREGAAPETGLPRHVFAHASHPE